MTTIEEVVAAKEAVQEYAIFVRHEERELEKDREILRNLYDTFQNVSVQFWKEHDAEIYAKIGEIDESAIRDLIRRR